MKASLKVAHISTVHSAFDQRIFHRECYSLAVAGYETHLIIHNSITYQYIDGVHIHSIGNKKSKNPAVNILGRIKSILKAGQLARKIPADIYHVHDPELIFLGLWLEATTKAAIIFDCHEDNTGYLQQKHYIKPLVRKMLIWAMRLTEKLAARHFDAIIAADKGVAKLFKKSYHASRVVTIHNFPRLELFPFPGDNQENKRPYDIVYHGTIPRYHLEMAFAVAKELKRRDINVRWLFFGKCPDAEWAKKEISKQGLEENFLLDPVPVPHEKVSSRVLQAKIGFIPLPDLPKFQHNIPTKLFEFMALGMPVVLSDLTPSRPFVGNGQCAFLVQWDNIHGYADAIITLLNKRYLRREMGTVGRKMIESSYNWDIEANKLIQLYNDLLK